MPTVKTSREDAVAAIEETFREYGYEGASLSRLSEATGLGRSSLYHYFPNGKDDMAKAVVERVSEAMERLVAAPLRGDGAPAQRLKAAMKGLAAAYDGGRRACLVDLFAIGDAAAAAPGLSGALAEGLASAFQTFSQDAGASPKEARLAAERAVVEIEGALVVARAIGSPAPFQRMLTRLPDILTPHSA